MGVPGEAMEVQEETTYFKPNQTHFTGYLGQPIRP